MWFWLGLRARQRIGPKTAHQDYVTALTDLRNQIGIPESAGAAEPLGEFTLPPFIPPVKEQEFVDLALQCRPDILAAQAGVTGTKAAENLARADRIPSPIIGPQYAMDEAGFNTLDWSTSRPYRSGITASPWFTSVRPTISGRTWPWNKPGPRRSPGALSPRQVEWGFGAVKETVGLTADLTQEVAELEHLFDQGQADLTKLIQARNA